MKNPNKINLSVPQFSQETIYSCIPACVQQVLGYYKETISQEKILESLAIPERGMSIPKAGSFAVKHGFNALIVTNNIHIFDPTWFNLNNEKLTENLKTRRGFVNEYNQSLVDDYLEYLGLGGKIKFDSIDSDLLTKSLSLNTPIIMELASTFLYKKSKSTEPGKFNDAFKGEITGHGVVIAGCENDKYKIIDPDTQNNPYSPDGIYWISAKKLITSFFILEGKSLLLISRE